MNAPAEHLSATGKKQPTMFPGRLRGCMYSLCTEGQFLDIDNSVASVNLIISSVVGPAGPWIFGSYHARRHPNVRVVLRSAAQFRVAMDAGRPVRRTWRDGEQYIGVVVCWFWSIRAIAPYFSSCQNMFLCQPACYNPPLPYYCFCRLPRWPPSSTMPS